MADKCVLDSGVSEAYCLLAVIQALFLAQHTAAYCHTNQAVLQVMRVIVLSHVKYDAMMFCKRRSDRFAQPKGFRRNLCPAGTCETCLGGTYTTENPCKVSCVQQVKQFMCKWRHVCACVHQALHAL
jgi:hypothetical protein